MSSGIIIIPFIAYLEAISIGKGFAKQRGYEMDSNQEFLAVGSASFITSFASGFPNTGDIARSAVNFQVRAASPLAGFLAGTIVLIAAEFLTEIFVYIPAATLAAVIIVASISIFDWASIKVC